MLCQFEVICIMIVIGGLKKFLLTSDFSLYGKTSPSFAFLLALHNTERNLHAIVIVEENHIACTTTAGASKKQLSSWPPSHLLRILFLKHATCLGPCS